MSKENTKQEFTFSGMIQEITLLEWLSIPTAITIGTVHAYFTKPFRPQVAPLFGAFVGSLASLVVTARSSSRILVRIPPKPRVLPKQPEHISKYVNKENQQ